MKTEWKLNEFLNLFILVLVNLIRETVESELDAVEKMLGSEREIVFVSSVDHIRVWPHFCAVFKLYFFLSGFEIFGNLIT